MCDACALGGFHREDFGDDFGSAVLKSNRPEYMAQRLLVDGRHQDEKFADGSVDVFIDKDNLHKKERRHVIKVLREIDDIIGTEVNYSLNDEFGDGTDIVVHHTDRGKDWDNGQDLSDYNLAAGLSWYHSDETFHSSWKDRDSITTFEPKLNRRGEQKYNKNGEPRIKETLTEYGKYVITHEILHSFALSHPMNDGRAPGFTQEDTVMSYNHDGNYYGIRPLDVAALQAVWGVG